MMCRGEPEWLPPWHMKQYLNYRPVKTYGTETYSCTGCGGGGGWRPHPSCVVAFIYKGRPQPSCRTSHGKTWCSPDVIYKSGTWKPCVCDKWWVTRYGSGSWAFNNGNWGIGATKTTKYVYKGKHM